jgi:Zn-dependent membrane protease YugP
MTPLFYMPGYYYYFDPYALLLMLPALILSIWAQFKVNSTYKKFSQVASRRGLTAMDACRQILNDNGLHQIGLETVEGNLSDHYDPKAGVIRLSRGVAESTSVAALGIAAHEAGHAIQYHVGYFPIKLRTAIIPVTQIGSSIAPLLLLAGLLFSYQPLILWGIAAFSLMLVFQLVTLPVEFNASRRAMQTLDGMNMLDDDELKGTRKVLSAAAMTYVAAMLVSLTQVLRLLLMFNRRRD